MARQLYDVKNEFIGAGNLSLYSFDFQITALDQIKIILTDATGAVAQEMRGDSLLSMVTAITFDPKNGGGTVQLAGNLATNAHIIMILAADSPKQTFQFRTNFNLDLNRFEQAMDAIVGYLQRARWLVDRSFKMDDADSGDDFDMAIPKGLPGTMSAIPVTNALGTGWASPANWIAPIDFAQLAYDAVVNALSLIDLAPGKIGMPTDGHFGTQVSTVAGDVTGIDDQTKVADGFDKVEAILEKLAPARSPFLSATPLAIAGSYAAKQSGTGTDVATVIDNTSPQIVASAAFSDGDSGTLSALIDSATVGTRVLTAADDTGTYGLLQITADVDPYVGVTGKAGFWKSLNARVNASVLSLGVHVGSLLHTLTGQRDLTFGVDDPGVSTTTFGAITTTGATGRYVSGVPSLATGDSIQVPITVANAVRTFYNATKVAQVSTPQTNTANVAPPGVAPASGANLTSSPSLTVLTNKYTEAVVISANGVNSKGTNGTVATTTPSIRIDTASTESRVSSGTGQYPSSGYGSAWVPTDLLSGNKELQMLGGSYQYPPLTNYTGNLPVAGPNYSGLTADSYASMRWVTFNLGSKSSVTSLLFTLAGANLGSSTLISGFAMYVRVDGATPTAGWIDANAAYPGTGNPTANGDPALDVGSSSTANTTSTRRVTLGAAIKTGNVIVRIGIPSGSTKQISGITLA